jgi:Bacterial pre-peptidase C-terminal domain
MSMVGRGGLGQFVGISTMAMLLVALPAAAAPVVELEPNSTFGTAQILSAGTFTLNFDSNIGGTGVGGDPVNTSTSIPHATITEPGDTSASLDFFRFTTGVAGQMILDIDSAPPPQNTNFDTMIHLFDAGGNPLATSDDNGNDPGDTPGATIGGERNSRIQTVVLPAGTYVVAVAAFPSRADLGGIVIDGVVPAGGTYTLNISAQVSAQAVSAPATLLALGAGLIGLGAGAWWRRR